MSGPLMMEEVKCHKCKNRRGLIVAIDFNSLFISKFVIAMDFYQLPLTVASKFSISLHPVIKISIRG